MIPGGLTPDARLLLLTRAVRMFGYGFLAVVLVLYLDQLGLDGAQIGLLLAISLAGDSLLSLWLTTRADRFGRRRVLVAGALLISGAGVVFALTSNPAILVAAATVGVMSPSGKEVGPFLAVEQAALSQTLPDRRRTSVFAWYNLVGQAGTAMGSLSAGLIVQLLGGLGFGALAGYRAVLLGYAAIGLGLGLGFLHLSPAVEAERPAHTLVPVRLGLHRSRDVVLRLAALFSVDAFAGGLVTQSLVAFWFHERFGVAPAVLGGIFFGANLLAAASSLWAARLAARFGLVNTMVFSHLPSNVLLMLVPFMPTLPLAIAALLARFSISQMDVPTRQSYTMAVVEPDERSAAAGVTGIARTSGAAVSPLLGAPLMASPGLAAVAFVLAGGLKAAYDLVLWRLFRSRPGGGEPRSAATSDRSASE